MAEIRRTAYGIPHILAGDYGSLGYGYGYAFAQDNLCVMADRVITLRGERSRYFGPAADSGDTLGASTDNLDSDIYYQSLRKSGIVRRLLARPAPLGPTARARQLVDGYVAGYNRYLHDTGVAHLPDPTCRGKAWVTHHRGRRVDPHLRHRHADGRRRGQAGHRNGAPTNHHGVGRPWGTGREHR